MKGVKGKTVFVNIVCSIFLILAGCAEEEALTGAEIIAPEDGAVTYLNSFGGGFDQSASPLEFQVVGADGKTPSEGVEIRFFGGLETVALADRNGNPLNQEDPLFFETETDERGLLPVDLFALWEVPPCKADLADPTKAGPDTTVTATVTATVGIDSKTWTMTITVKGGTQGEGCVLSS